MNLRYSRCGASPHFAPLQSGGFKLSALEIERELLALLEASGTREQDEVFEPSEARPLIAYNRASSMEDLRIVLEWAPTGYRDFVASFGLGVWP